SGKRRRFRGLDRLYPRAKKAGSEKSGTDFARRKRKPDGDLARTWRHDDRTCDRDAHQQEFGESGCEAGGTRRTLWSRESERSHHVVESDAELRARTWEHASPGTGYHAWSPGSQ